MNQHDFIQPINKKQT